MQESKQTRDMFLTRSLEHILNDREIRRSQNSNLREECKKTLDKIKTDLKASGLHEGGDVQFAPIEADAYFPVFELACQSKSPSIVSNALDCLQKMIVYGMLVGNTPDEASPGQPLINRVITAICHCFTGVNTDEKVQLQIIKVLVAAVTSNNCEVHEATLLKAVRTSYNIYLASRNPVNQTTARATLTQMINVIFSRMEKQAEKLQSESEEASEQSSAADKGGDGGEEQEEIAGKAAIANGFAAMRVSGDLGDAEVNAVVEQILNELVDEVVKSVAERNELENPDDECDEASSIASSAATDATSTTTTKLQLESEALQRSLSFSHVLQKDAFLVFRSFCKLSMKPLSEGPPDPKSHELRSKILSLHLLYTILESAGPFFRNNDMFISAIKQYLCVALGKNAVSTVPEVFRLSLKIFVKLLLYFKTHLKMQIQVFFKEIFLNILDSSSSSLLHKSLVLDTLLDICSDPQTIVDIYVNYDCDLNAANIFEQLVSLLRKTAQIGGVPQPANNAVEVKEMRKKSLKCLYTLVSGLVEWCNDLYVNPQAMSNLGKEPQTELGEQKKLSVSGASGSSRSLHSDSSDTASSNPNLSQLAIDNPEALEVAKQQKGILEQGINMFNHKPNKGVAFLQAQSMIGSAPVDVARFLHTEMRLDPSMVGDYLGEHEKMNKEVMYAYVDYLNFASHDFVTAIRLLLEGFRLPGESQKIDRIMEKFASRYLDCNPHGTVFATADAAYVLAFSIIMLTTDLHNSQVKRKMTPEDYIKMNRGINDNKDLPREYLEEIYNKIKEKEISLKSTRGGVTKTTTFRGNVSAAQRMREMQEIADNAKEMMEAASHVQAEFICTKHLEHVRPMFKSCWNPLMAAFSIGFHYIDDRDATRLCLGGLQCSIRIACIFGLSLERDSLINTLSRFSMLEDTVGIRQLEWKNREAIMTLIQVACTDGNYLQQSWKKVLKCMSHLDLIQSIGSGVKDQTTAAIKKNAVNMADNTPILTKTFGMENKRLATIQESMGETSSQSYVVAVDKIFADSTRLDGDAIVDFVDCLCEVSLGELNNPLHPRMFSLQKLVEISYYNMGRIRLQWARIWAILGEHFNVVGCSDIEEVADFAVDSLRQLATKFLEKGELPGYSFQKDFLRPFEHIAKHNPRLGIQDMVLCCIDSMVSKQAHNIKSGWKNIFSVFTIAAAHENERLVDLAYTTASTIIKQHFEFYFASIIHCFQDAISALREFSCSLFPDTSMEAIQLIRQCANYVAEKPKYFEDLTGDEPQYGARAGDKIWVRGWFPIFFELSCIINRCKLDVRTRGLTVMFEIMKTFGDTFHETWWHDLFQIIFRIFDQMKMPEVQIERTDWFATTCNHALFSICDVFTQFYPTLAPTLLPGVYDQLLWCIEKENEQLARSGVNCFENLIISNGHLFDAETWQLTCQKAKQIFDQVAPSHLLTWNPQRNGGGTAAGTSELKRLQLCCVLTSEMIECIDNFLFLPKATKTQDEANLKMATADEVDEECYETGELFPRLTRHQLLLLVQSLNASHTLAKRFNADLPQRDLLWRAGFKGKTKPNLIRQETTSLTCALRILFRIHHTTSTDDEEDDERIFELLLKFCRIAISYYVQLEVPTHRDSWGNILLLVLAKLLRMPHDKFVKLSSALHASMCDLLLFDMRAEVRLLFRKYLIRHHSTLTSGSDGATLKQQQNDSTE